MYEKVDTNFIKLAPLTHDRLDIYWLYFSIIPFYVVLAPFSWTQLYWLKQKIAMADGGAVDQLANLHFDNPTGEMVR